MWLQATKTPSDIEGDLSPEEVRWEYIKVGGRACNGQSQAGQQINQVIAAHMQKLEQVSVSLSILIRANKRVCLCVCVRARACVHLRVCAHAKICVMVCC